jgi:hypothetical protein
MQEPALAGISACDKTDQVKQKRANAVLIKAKRVFINF